MTTPHLSAFSASGRVRPAVRALAPSLLRASLLNYSLGERHRVRNSFKFLFRSLAHPWLTRRWLARLGRPELQPLWLARPRMAIKLQRPYLESGLDCARKLAYLDEHYAVSAQRLSHGLLPAIHATGLVLLELRGEAGAAWRLVLSCRDEFEMEGELTLSVLEAGSGLNLASLTFCLGRRAFVIGGLQASNDERTRGLIHDASKAMHGLRPKALVLWFLQEWTRDWQAGALHAVGDSVHIYRHWRKRKDIAASYDEFWAESDGTQLVGGLWSLPLCLRERTRAELKPNRRRTHERRYEMLGRLRPCFLGILAALGAWSEDAKAWRPGQFSLEAGETVPTATGAQAGVRDHSF